MALRHRLCHSCHRNTPFLIRGASLSRQTPSFPAFSFFSFSGKVSRFRQTLSGTVYRPPSTGHFSRELDCKLFLHESKHLKRSRKGVIFEWLTFRDFFATSGDFSFTLFSFLFLAPSHFGVLGHFRRYFFLCFIF